MFKGVSIAILFTLLLTHLTAHGSETDGFTLRYEEYADGIPAIEIEINQRMVQAVDEANYIATQCSDDALQRSLKKLFLRRLYGKIEEFINSSEKVSKRRITLAESIYKYIRPYGNIPAHLGMMGFGSILRTHLDGEPVLIGADKFGHFMDQGFQYYSVVKQSASPLTESLNAAFKLGDKAEDGLFGLITTGVRSYGDLAANYNGLVFWSNLLAPVLPNSNPYLKCVATSEQKSHWEIVRPFIASEYVDAAWDEGVNCSHYRSKSYEASVLAAIEDLKLKTPGRTFDCPILPQACAKLALKYGKIAHRILHPMCLAEKT